MMSNDHDLNKNVLEDGGSLEVGQGDSEGSGSASTPSKSTRPPIVYSSPGAFAKSFGTRWRSVWTRQFTLALVAGQVVSLCITCTNVTTTELVNRGWTLSTTQGTFLWVNFHWSDHDRGLFIDTNVLLARYFTLFIVYTPYTIYQCA